MRPFNLRRAQAGIPLALGEISPAHTLMLAELGEGAPTAFAECVAVLGGEEQRVAREGRGGAQVAGLAVGPSRDPEQGH